MASRREILATKVVTKAISRIAAATSIMLQRFGMAPGGPNVSPARQRRFTYDVFNDTRQLGSARAPGVQSATARRQIIGEVSCTIPRMAEKLPLLYEEMHNQRQVGGSTTDIDVMGQSYVARQQRFLGQRASNFRLALLGGMMRGNLYVHEDAGGGDDTVDLTG